MGQLTIDFINKYVKKKDVFIETGSFAGATINNMLHHFNEIYSIEKSKKYFDICTEKFKKYGHVIILKGNSPDILPRIIDRTKYTLFWLDAHWMADTPMKDLKAQDDICPIIKELKAIGDMNCFIMIDDLHLFGKEKGFPSLKKLEKYIKIISLDNNVICCEPI